MAMNTRGEKRGILKVTQQAAARLRQILKLARRSGAKSGIYDCLVLSCAVELLRCGQSARLPLQRLVQPFPTSQPRFRAAVVLFRPRLTRRKHRYGRGAAWRRVDGQ